MMRALSIRQPYVEEILRGIKTAEMRGWEAHIIDERFYIYASLKPGEGRDIPKRFKRLGAEVGGLPTGLLVGTARITHVTRNGEAFHWHLADVKRLVHPRRPTKQPQPAWFWPFGPPK